MSIFVELDHKKTLENSDVLLVSDKSGNVGKVTTEILKNQIGANVVTQKTDISFLTATQSSFLVGGSDEKSAAIVLDSYGGAKFDIKKKGTAFSVSDVFKIEKGTSLFKGTTISFEPSEKVEVKLKGKASFEIGTHFVSNDDGVKISALKADSVLTSSLIVESGSDSVQIGSMNGLFRIEAKGKNSKKEMESFIALSGTETAFKVALKGNTILEVSNNLLFVLGAIDAKLLSGELKTSKISTDSLSVVYGKGKEAFSVNSGNMGDIQFKVPVQFEGTATLKGLSEKQIESLDVEAGTLVFNSTKKVFQGYNGKSWASFK